MSRRIRRITDPEESGATLRYLKSEMKAHYITVEDDRSLKITYSQMCLKESA
jgi:hypothetical protein